MATTRQVMTISGISLLTAGIGYCFYFDYKRRNDPAFRKALQREQRKVQKTAKASQQEGDIDVSEMLKAAVDAVNAEPLPQGVDEKEQFFMEQVGMGEMLAQRMPQGAMPAAIAFFKAYKVYPSPQELMMIYQRTMPPEVFMLVMEMVKLDVTSLRSAAGPSQPAGEALIEELTGAEREAAEATASAARSQKSSSADTSPPNSSAAGAAEKSPAQSTAPSETGSQNGHSFVLVDDSSSPAAPSSASEEVRPAPSSLAGSLHEVEKPEEAEEEEKVEAEVEVEVEAAPKEVEVVRLNEPVEEEALPSEPLS